MKFLPVIAACVLAAALPAEAQIYSWRDASGTLVLSNKPRPDGGDVTTYAVPGSTLRTTTAASRASDPYEDLIREHAQTSGVSADLVRAVIQAESAFNPRAVSAKGAMGLMQLMPATARELGVRDPFHPAENIRGGVTYLARLLARYRQNVELALAAYNAGPGSVDRYGQTVPPYRETQAYVKKITGRTAGVSPPAPPGGTIYRWMEIVDGRAITRYSNVPPKDLPYEVVGRR